MPKKSLTKMSVAVATGRVAAVFLEGNKVVGTKMSRKAAKDPQSAVRIVGSWIKGFGPDHMITEDPKSALRKGKKAINILETITTLFEKTDGLDVKLSRVQVYQNKYEEAKALASTYPEIAHLRPQRPPIWMPEPRNMSYFEALSFVEQLSKKA